MYQDTPADRRGGIGLVTIRAEKLCPMVFRFRLSRFLRWPCRLLILAYDRVFLSRQRARRYHIGVGHTGTTLVRSPARQQIVLILIVVLGVIVPFSNRAVYMDEHIYLGLAQSALNNPMFPQDVRTLYFGAWFKNAADHTHPPVGEYHLALIYRLVGKFSETSFRLLFATPYAVMAVLGFYGLAARFTFNAFWVTLVSPYLLHFCHGAYHDDGCAPLRAVGFSLHDRAPARAFLWACGQCYVSRSR